MPTKQLPRALNLGKYYFARTDPSDWFNRPRNPSNPDPDGIDQLVRRSLLDLRSFSDEGGEGVSPTWQAPEIHLDDGRTLVLEYS